ncbi:DUF4199 domain-containing protein [Paraurantiacibacter namhicola]|uniref:DUF4199 domain-containing protein n=1 Tax=Paraurantiacibacter namhicola TaxID=645517 RepID=A0A1C7DA30_9SPHN|nr:DUF4199 domain-containing protein [Paraurantiacibacter namhicola]ANU08287.1 hypothetical protein A6F65_01997 [Paraurantiacibacter namhicola]
MFRYALIFGSIAGVVAIAIISLILLSVGGNHSSSEFLGYLVMLVVMMLVFVGIKRYRDMEQGGVIRFGTALGLGVAITAVAGVFYVLSWELFLAATDYAFITEYSNGLLAEARAMPDAVQSAERIKEIEASVTLYRNPAFRMMISFIELFPVGLFVSLLSAFLLRKPGFLPANSPA